jgi:hypothetical protein
MRWADFERTAGEVAAAGRRLLTGADGVSIGFLATAADAVHLSPVCPIFCADGLYVIAAARSPKTADLRRRGLYALHAFLGPNDEEFQISGRAIEVLGENERADVHAAVRFAAFNRADPIFDLDVDSALWVHWERVGTPDTKAVRRRWP